MTTSKTTPSVQIGALLIDKAADVKYKNVCAVIVWKDDLETIAYYMLFTRKTGECLGRTTTLRYLDECQTMKA